MATADAVTVNEDSGATTIAVLSNDNDGPDAGETLTVNGVTQGTNGTVVIVAAGLSYTPNLNFFGVDTFSYTIGDGNNGSATATVTVTINPVNDKPSFTKGANQSVTSFAPQSIVGWATGISPGPANESAQTLTFNITGNTNPGLFSVQPAVSSTGILTYTPAAGGLATITLTLSDSGGTANGGVNTSDAVTFTITVATTQYRLRRRPEPAASGGYEIQCRQRGPAEVAVHHGRSARQQRGREPEDHDQLVDLHRRGSRQELVPAPDRCQQLDLAVQLADGDQHRSETARGGLHRHHYEPADGADVPRTADDYQDHVEVGELGREGLGRYDVPSRRRASTTSGSFGELGLRARNAL